MYLQSFVLRVTPSDVHFHEHFFFEKLNILKVL